MFESAWFEADLEFRVQPAGGQDAVRLPLTIAMFGIVIAVITAVIA